MNTKTVIIGGGMAGISAAIKLKEYDRDFLMITGNLGGRVKYSKEYHVNLGAYFVINNYSHAKKILKKEKWLNIADALFVEDKDNHFRSISITMLSLIPQILKLLLIIIRFGSHYKKVQKKL